MAAEPATITYIVAEPFERAVRLLRTALAQAHLRLAGELDMSSRIRERLLMGIPACQVFLVAATPAELDELSVDPRAAALTPLHIVVSAHGAGTEIHLMRAMRAQDSPLEEPAMEVYRNLHVRITEAIERIGMRVMPGV